MDKDYFVALRDYIELETLLCIRTLISQICKLFENLPTKCPVGGKMPILA